MIRTYNNKGKIAEKLFFRKYYHKLTKLKALPKKLYYASEFEKKQTKKTHVKLGTLFDLSYQRNKIENLLMLL